MPNYFFHLSDGDFHTADDTGSEFASLELAELAALRVIDSLRADDPAWLRELSSPSLKITNSSGEVLSSLPFGAIEKLLN